MRQPSESFRHHIRSHSKGEEFKSILAVGRESLRNQLRCMCPKSRQEHDSLRNLHCACTENLKERMKVKFSFIIVLCGRF